ncbi:MAG TPA: glycosyltransferase family 9 protein [Candidatus Kapabacteria bacterium]|nr:glycosyltransferase family 9 protein [Candidatus Kapabacteria bacterium]
MLSHRILIVRTDRIGDVVLTLPMARAIKQGLPSSHVVFLAREYTLPIVERSPDADETLTAEPDDSLRELIRIFRSANVDVAFFPSPRFRLAFAAWFARIPKRIGTGYRWYSFLFTDRIFEHRKTAERHEAEFNLRMLKPLGISAPKDELPTILLRNPERMAVEEWLSTNLGNSRSKFAVLHVTNGGSTPPWPTQNFVELGRMIFERYGMTIILTGLRREAMILDGLAASIGDALVFAGRSLPELAALLERASVVVAASTGPGHLAAALGASTVGLFSLPPALSKERWGFRGPRVRNLSPEPIAQCPTCEHCMCMERLEMGSVMNAIDSVLRSSSDS